MSIKGEHNNGELNLQCDEDGNLVTRSIIEEEIEHAASKGDAFTFHVTEAAIDTGDTVLFVKNNDSALLVLDRCTLNGDVASIMNWQIRLGTATTTPSGGALTPVNLYPTFSGKTFTHVSLTDETAVAAGSLIEEHKVQVLGSAALVPLHGIILGKGHYVQFDIVGTTPVVGMTLWAHWESEAI